ncbi:phage tail tube protein [Devriesea agamarum]|uniref:phage tail tube protein n=1 Tax=Devriesea agamarum TaxID=472569 RepID=UPI00071D5D29|nr:hypothetical protein [Devriesea agamarum]
MSINNILTGGPVTATGGLVHAPVGTPFPDNVRDPWDAAFKKGGYVGEDGVTRTIDKSDEKIKAWGGDVVKVVTKEHSLTYKLTFLESRNADTLKLLFGEENVIVSNNEFDDITVEVRSNVSVNRAFGLDMKDGDYKVRECIYNGRVSLAGDVNYVHSDIIAYEVTIETFPNSNGAKNKAMSGRAVKRKADPKPTPTPTPNPAPAS